MAATRAFWPAPGSFSSELLRLRLPHHRWLRGHQPDAAPGSDGECGHQRRWAAVSRRCDGRADRPICQQSRASNQRPVIASTNKLLHPAILRGGMGGTEATR